MSTIDEIMSDVQSFASTWALVGGRFDDGSMHNTAEDQSAALRDLIAAALAEARREGAEAMREKYNAMRQALEVIAVGDSNAPASDAADTLVACDEWQAGSPAAARADGSMPLPTGKRQAVRLTDEQIVLPVIHGFGATTNDWASHIEYAHAIESAVLAANGLGDGNE